MSNSSSEMCCFANNVNGVDKRLLRRYGLSTSGISYD